tara:strand:+ start:176 stop:466 length:291 start_codon:yes stop_codon:yes gene_type:complete
MALIEDTDTLDVYLEHFSKSCQISGGIKFLGILNAPAEIIGSGLGISIEYLLRAKTSDVSTASRGTSITIDSVKYTVRENMQEDDGSFSTLLLSKV